MSYIVNLTVTGRRAVVVGAGSVAGGKVRDLLEAGADVVAVAPAVCPDIRELAAASRIRLLRRPYSARDLRGAFLAVAATDDEVLNARVSRDAQSRGILVNVVDRPALCSFTLPAVVRRGDLTVAISTEGQCPALAGVLREELSGRFGPEWSEAVRFFGELRRDMIARGWKSDAIRDKVRQLHQSGIANLIGGADRTALAALLRAHLGAGFPLPAEIEAP